MEHTDFNVLNQLPEGAKGDDNMDAEGREIPVVEGDMGEGFKDPIEELGKFDELQKQLLEATESTTPLGQAELPGYVHKDMEHWAEEYECAMKHLDDLKVPRHDETEKVFSLVGRINKAISLAST
jgi:hypothetical protein